VRRSIRKKPSKKEFQKKGVPGINMKKVKTQSPKRDEKNTQ